jgi:hypothetical protein
MSALPGFLNPLLYAQFHMRGGWKNTLGVAAGYALLVGGGIWITARNSTNNSYMSAMQGCLHLLLGLQLFILLVYGSMRVSSAVRGDIASKIMESHRLMPMSAFSAVAGYVVGGPVQATSLAVVNFLIGLPVCSGASVDVECWLIANFMLGAFVLLSWVLTAQLAFAARAGFVLLLIVTALSVVSNASTLALLPGLSVLICPLIGRSVFRLTATFDNLSFPFAVALVSQFAIGGICFRAAMRKYRMPDAVGMSTFLGLLLLITWVSISLMGISRLDDFVSQYGFRSDTAVRIAQFVATVLATMLLALIPISSSARALGEWRRNGGATPVQPRRPMPLAFAVLPSVIITCMLLVASPIAKDVNTLTIQRVQTVVIVLASLFGIAMLFRWFYLGMSKAWLVALIWLVLTWILPMLADLVYHLMLPEPPESLTMISALSPIGALILTWKPPETPTPVVPGIIFQCAMVLLPTMLYSSASRRKAVTVAALAHPALS